MRPATETLDLASEDLRYEPIKDMTPIVVLVPNPFEPLSLPVIEL